jgi:hypothetical protein
MLEKIDCIGNKSNSYRINMIDILMTGIIMHFLMFEVLIKYV